MYVMLVDEGAALAKPARKPWLPSLHDRTLLLKRLPSLPREQPERPLPSAEDRP